MKHLSYKEHFRGIQHGTLHVARSTADTQQGTPKSQVPRNTSVEHHNHTPGNTSSRSSPTYLPPRLPQVLLMLLCCVAGCVVAAPVPQDSTHIPILLDERTPIDQYGGYGFR